MHEQMTPSSDAIWEAVLRGESAAWRTLVVRYQSLVYAIAVRSGLSSLETADCFQHTWVALFEHRRNITDSRRLPGWLATTTRREAQRILSQRRREQSSEVLELQPDRAALPDQELEATERQFAIENGLAQLDPRCRLLLQALFFEPEETSYDQLGRSLKLSINAIGPFRKRCLQRLKKILEQSGFLDARDQRFGTLLAGRKAKKADLKGST